MKDVRITAQVAYLLGAIRDGAMDIRPGKNYEVKVGQKDRQWLVLLQAMFRETFGFGGSITKHMGSYYILRITRKSVVEELRRVSEFKSPQSKWNTPSVIVHQSLRILKTYIRGFFDAEGGVPEDPRKWRYVSFDQKNRESLEFVRNILIRIGYRPTNPTFTSSVWQFRLTRNEDLVRFCKWIKPKHPSKRAALRLLAECLDSRIRPP